MKKKMAIVLSLVLACSMSMTAFAAPSPSLNTGNTPVSQVTVDQSVATATAGTAESTVSGVASATSAVAVGTTFATAKRKPGIGCGFRSAGCSSYNCSRNDNICQRTDKGFDCKKVKIINKSGEKNISLLNQGRQGKNTCAAEMFI